MQDSTGKQYSTFGDDVLAGLSATPKTLSSKYFYDDEGSRLFQQIMRMPEYYLTDAEMEILSEQTEAIFESFTVGADRLDLIELGAGDGTKTAVLVDHFLKRSADITYSPIDISGEAVDSLTSQFREQFPGLAIKPHLGDYFRILETLKGEGDRRKVLLFLGSNIGNFSDDRALEFFRGLRSVMRDDDLLFIGFDLKKDPHIIVKAYDDPAGITAAFNLNLLHRINRELGGDFDVDKFSHYALYLPDAGAARSFLISRERQTVNISALGRSFDFAQWEAVFVEVSQKYTIELINELAEGSGFEVAHNFFDRKRWYVDSLWKPAPAK